MKYACVSARLPVFVLLVCVCRINAAEENTSPKKAKKDKSIPEAKPAKPDNSTHKTKTETETKTAKTGNKAAKTGHKPNDAQQASAGTTELKRAPKPEPARIPAKPKKTRAATAAQIARRLEQRINVDYFETELQDIIRDISAMSGINLIIDSNVEREKKISLQVKNMPVCKVLRWVADLSGYHLLYKDEAILITDRKNTRMVTFIYPISDLLLPGKSHYPPGMEDDDDDDDDDDDGDQAREKLLEIIRKCVNSDSQ